MQPSTWCSRNIHNTAFSLLLPKNTLIILLRASQASSSFLSKAWLNAEWYSDSYSVEEDFIPLVMRCSLLILRFQLSILSVMRKVSAKMAPKNFAIRRRLFEVCLYSGHVTWIFGYDSEIKPCVE